jgi:radical SAM family RiPP maturation amino acid epimerase
MLDGDGVIPRKVAAERYWHLIERRSPAARRTLALVKRFAERYVADPRFRQSLGDNPEAPERVAEAYGIEIDPRLALPLFHPDFVQFRCSDLAAEKWPLAAAWDDYLAEITEWRDLYLRNGDCPDVNPRFHSWRERHIRRTANELGPIAKVIQHPVFAFELSVGCSVGCWFCGVSAEKFSGAFPYTDQNARLWRAVLGQNVELFGPAAQAGFCYWATDPSDNPDYPRFLEDYYAVTGALPQTTTARPLANLDFTRSVLRLSEHYRGLPNRFSILTLNAFDAVHETFTAEELLHVELVLLNRESLTTKAVAGRARERLQTMTRAGKAERLGNLAPDQTTIACVTGFLVNMINRTVRLITPVRASERWPLGYRVYGERQFATADDYRAAIEHLIVAHMSGEICGADIVRFRDDVIYVRRPDGFELQTANTRFALGGFESAARLGDLIQRGDMTAAEIRAALVRAGADIFTVTGTLQQLFAHGLVSEDPAPAVGIAKREDLPLIYRTESAATAVVTTVKAAPGWQVVNR